MGFSKVVNMFIPESQAINKEFVSKTKLVIGVAMCMSVVAALNALRQFSVDHTTNGILILMAVVLMFVALIIFKFNKSLVFVSNSVTALIYAIITFLTFSFGGLSSNVGSWFCLVILLAIILTGFRSGLFWGVLSIVTVVAFWVVELAGYTFDAPVIKTTGFFIGCFILCLAVLGLGIIYELTSIGSEKQLKKERTQSEEQTRILGKAITEVKEIMKGAAQSNFSQRLVGDYKDELLELKTSINATLEILNQTITDVSDVSNLFIGGSEQLSASTGELAETAHTQAATLNKISYSMKEIEDKTKLNSEHATDARELAANTMKMVQNGQDKMKDMLQSIQEINKTSKEVTKVVKVIDEIAFQTNLLALNAAVEAARAGIYGKGFAVVADEVRKLAGRSSKAAKNTTDLVHNSDKQLDNGVELADQMAELQTDIVAGVEQVNSLIEEISTSSADQSTEIKGINIGLGEVNDVINGNTNLTSKTASLSNELTERAIELRQTMHRFTLTKEQSEAQPVIAEIPHHTTWVEA